MTVRASRLHHRPAVRRLTGGLGTYRWVVACPHCTFYAPTTFWRTALVKALLHSEVLR